MLRYISAHVIFFHKSKYFIWKIDEGNYLCASFFMREASLIL